MRLFWCSQETGRRVPCHELAPQVLISNSMLVPSGYVGDFLGLGRWAHHVRTDDSRELDHIGTQGILQGTYETFAEAARQHFGAVLPESDSHCRLGRDGRSSAFGCYHE